MRIQYMAFHSIKQILYLFLRRRTYNRSYKLLAQLYEKSSFYTAKQRQKQTIPTSEVFFIQR